MERELGAFSRKVARRTGRFPQLVDPRGSVNGLLLTGSPRFRKVRPEERRGFCRLTHSRGSLTPKPHYAAVDQLWRPRPARDPSI